MLGSILARRYRLGPTLGRGAQGEVFRAHDLIAGEDVALKLAHGGPKRFQGATALREAVALRMLRVPGVVHVLDEGEHEGRAFVEKTKSEPLHLYYEFTVNGDEVFCREGYIGAEGTLAHLENIGAELGEALKIADLTRLEFHGPAEEIEKLKTPLAHLNPAWFVIECGVPR